MPRKPQPWFRFYVETMSDRKIRRLAPAERWVWAGVLAAARESVEPGRLLIAEGEPMTIDDLADYADVPKRTAVTAVEKMRRFGMVRDDDGVLTVTNFGKRQFESDVSTARTRTHRERSNEQGRNVPTSTVGTVPSRARPTETDNRTNSSTAVRSPNVPPGTAARIIRVYVDACHATGIPAPEESQARVERSARSLLAQGYPPASVEDAARNAAAGGWTDLATQLQRDTARASPRPAAGSTTDQRVTDALDLAARLEQPDRRTLG